MPEEIERKFLVVNENWRTQKAGVFYQQGYIHAQKNCSVRVRAVDGKGYLAVKGETHGSVRDEFEYEIPVEDANELLQNFCIKPLIKKKRYKIKYSGLVWEVDAFEGENKGLLIAEVELSNKNQRIKRPNWVGEEVTGNPKYYNVNLVKNPFLKWAKNKE
jgi:CYTH domain-containing protein